MRPKINILNQNKNRPQEITYLSERISADYSYFLIKGSKFGINRQSLFYCIFSSFFLCRHFTYCKNPVTGSARLSHGIMFYCFYPLLFIWFICVFCDKEACLIPPVSSTQRPVQALRLQLSRSLQYSLLLHSCLPHCNVLQRHQHYGKYLP